MSHQVNAHITRNGSRATRFWPIDAGGRTMALEGSERKLLHAIVREQGNAQAGYVEDSKIAEIAYLSIEEVRDCLRLSNGKSAFSGPSG